MKNQRGGAKIGSIIISLILIIILIVSFNIYKKVYFSGFEKATTKPEGTNFLRDSNIKYSENSSYKIENIEYNDAAFYKEVEVEPNTPYRITCMVKTENVECEFDNVDGGVVIGLLDTVQYSAPITGTNDWQKMEFIFDSRQATTVKISFRLGGNQNNCKGTAWFSDFKLEKGTKNTDTEWNVACFFMNEIDVNIEGKNYNLKLNDTDKENARLNLERFKADCYEFTGGKMTINSTIYEIEEPITSLTYSEEHGYHVTPEDVKKIIYETVKQNEYDHIFIVCRMESEDGNVSIPIINNWIGLGSMDMYDIGFSLIRINKNANEYAYRYGITNQAPEEVFLHEFLHTLERNSREGGFNAIELHDYEKYGYTEAKVDGLNDWYTDYMNGEVYNEVDGTYVGLPEFVYTTQPFNSENFKYPVELELYDEAQNLFEEIQSMVKVLTKQD